MPLNPLAEHADTLEKVIGFLIVIVLSLIGAINGLLFWSFRKLSTKVESAIQEHHLCREDLPRRFLAKDDFREWIQTQWLPFMQQRRSDWDKLWDRFDGHTHSPKGRVMR